MKKLGYILFLALFVLLALIPSVGMLLFGPSEARANEQLALPPELTEDGKFNVRVLNDAADYMQDRFWLRQQLITAEARLEAALLHESACDKVLLGRDGWLFYQSTLDSYRGSAQMSERELWAAAHTLALIREYAAENGASFLFVLVPNKNSVYPEYMPAQISRAEGPTERERLCLALEAEGVEHLDLLPVLQNADRTLYQRTDSHWSNLGAALAHDAIAEALGRSERFYDPAQFTARQDHEADLYRMLYPASTELEWQDYPVWSYHYSYVRPIRSPEDNRIETENPGQSGSLLMFRDSFANTLHTFLAESWGSAFFSRAMPYDLQLLQGQDTLVLELVERNLVWLAERPPILPAPERSLTQTPAQTDERCALLVEQDARSGMLRLSGELTCVDTTSPVWLDCGGTVYEASPAGEGENAFTAYLTFAPQSVRVLFLQDGALCAADCDLIAIP